MSLEQLSFLPPPRLHDGVPLREERAYVIQGTEKPADLPRLRESAATMEALVLSWFKDQRARFERTGASEDVAHTPTQCAEALRLKLTTVRPRITQLVRAGHLEACRWLPRRPTEAGSEGWFRYREDE